MFHIVILIMLSACIGAWNPDCTGKNDSKVGKSRSSALLYAHRCFLRDVPVKVPSPVNTIPDFIIPSHVVVPKCSGNYIELATHFSIIG